MRDKIEIQGIGEVYIKPPRSFVTIHDLITEHQYASDQYARLSRISAALVGICWDHQKNKLHPPVYDVSSAKIVEYGGEVLEWLILRKVNLPKMFNDTTPLYLELWKLMPKEEEVAKATDTFPAEGDSGSGGDENRETVESRA